MARSNGYAPDLLVAVDAVNRRQKSRLFQHIQRHYDGALAGRTFALWGANALVLVNHGHRARSPRAALRAS